MTCQYPYQNRKAYEAGNEPVHQGRQRTPKRQVRSVVHVERRQEDDVGNGHAGYVHMERPCPSFRYSADHAGTKGQYAEDKEVVIGWPSKKGKSSHGKEDHHQTPVVDGTSRRVPTAAFRR